MSFYFKRSFFVAICLLLSQLITADNPDFLVEKSGKGSNVILFIPGFACAGEVWHEIRSAFESNHTCYTFTMAGFAGAPPQASSTFANWESALARFILDNHLYKPTIVGHSLGGGLAMAIAADYPSLIGGIVVVDALPCLSALRKPSFQSVDKPDCSYMLKGVEDADSVKFKKIQLANVRQLVADTSYYNRLVEWSIKSDRTTFVNLYCDYANTDLRQKIATVQCPTLILLEEFFSNFSTGIDEQFSLLKSARIEYATKGLHFIMYDDPEWLLSRMENFIK